MVLSDSNRTWIAAWDSRGKFVSSNHELTIQIQRIRQILQSKLIYASTEKFTFYSFHTHCSSLKRPTPNRKFFKRKDQKIEIPHERYPMCLLNFPLNYSSAKKKLNFQVKKLIRKKFPKAVYSTHKEEKREK